MAACYQLSSFNAVLVPSGYPTARVQQAHPLGEPRRMYADRAYWAVYQFDLQLYWLSCRHEQAFRDGGPEQQAAAVV